MVRSSHSYDQQELSYVSTILTSGINAAVNWAVAFLFLYKAIRAIRNSIHNLTRPGPFLTIDQALTMPLHNPKKLDDEDVCIVGAGPAGLMLGALLARFGVSATVVDERPDPTTVGRADGIQPKTIETFQMMGLGDELLRDGVRVHDICMWRSSSGEPLHRISREVHYPSDCVDVLQPYILLCHQGMIEGLLLDDLHDSGGLVHRSKIFESYKDLDAESEAAESVPMGRGNQAARGHVTSVGHANVHTHVHANTARARALPIAYEQSMPDDRVTAKCRDESGRDLQVTAGYLVGCDGARSRVRGIMQDTFVGKRDDAPPSHHSAWGVLDGELDTDFPDIWSKTVVHSEEFGTVLMIPRERNLTRLYIEMTQEMECTERHVMDQARRILQPYRVDWRRVEWFGNYKVAQRVAAQFADANFHVFLAGDASHTHSPKAAQGMNTSVHDSWNLAWKLNLAVRKLARPELLATYEDERRKVALDLINFDFEHANQIAAGDAAALTANFRTNCRFISGVGVEYGYNVLNLPEEMPATLGGAVGGGPVPAVGSGDGMAMFERARPGCNLPPAIATRYIDANPVDLQLDIPVLGQFRVYFFVPDVVSKSGKAFLQAFNETTRADGSIVAELAEASAHTYNAKPRPTKKKDVFVRPERYIPISDLFTFCLITSTDKNRFEINDLPSVFSRSAWTVYLDDVPYMDTHHKKCIDKWFGGLGDNEVAVMNVRPDGYVGSLHRWQASEAAGVEASQWLDKYYGGFLRA